jgi:hypothetical protein
MTDQQIVHPIVNRMVFRNSRDRNQMARLVIVAAQEVVAAVGSEVAGEGGDKTVSFPNVIIDD